MQKGHRSQIWLYVLALLGLILFLFLSWNDPSWTEESHYLKKDVAIEKARDFLEQEGWRVQNWNAQAILDGNSSVDGYLTKYKLQDEFKRKAPAQAALTFWKVTLSDPSSSDNYTVEIEPVAGNVISYDRVMQTPYTTAQQSNVRTVAESALQHLGVRTRSMVITGGALQTLQAQQDDIFAADTPAPQKVRTFKFTDPTWHVGELKMHYEVTVYGGEVKVLRPVYDLPAAYTAWHSKQKSVGALLVLLNVVLTFVLFVLAFVFLFLIKQRKPYRGALWLSAVVFVLFLVSNYNEYPLLQAGLVGGGASMLVQILGNALLLLLLVVLALVVAGGTFPMILTGGMLAAELKPQLWTSWKSPDWSVRIRQAMWRGYLLAAAWLGFQALFYWVAQTYFGVYAESDYSMSPSNVWMPTLLPLLGWLAGVQEEMTYRLFGINFFKRYWKNTLLATLLPAVIWALGHSTYAIFPVYTRLIELTIFGVLIGYCYLWYGIETTIFAHAVFDITQMCIPLALSGVWSQEIAGFTFFVSPVVVAYGLGLLQPRRKKFV